MIILLVIHIVYLCCFYYVIYTVSIRLTAGANYDEKQDVAKQRTQERSAHHVILSDRCQSARSSEPDIVAQTV